MIEDNIVLVCGATGQQGRAVVRALQASNSRWTIKALTRNPSSSAAKALARTGVTPVEGDMNDPDSLKRAFEGAAGVFNVQGNFLDDAGREVRFGQNVVNAAVSTGVDHMVFSSVGGAERDSGVPHFESKRQVELHLLESGIRNTILRPASFMDNFASFSMRTIVLSMMRSIMSPHTELQLVATEDIGQLAARAFEMPERYVGRQIELAGDSLKVPEIMTTLRSGGIRPTVGLMLPSFVLRRLPPDFTIMVRWFESHGFDADIPALKSELPELRSLEEWAGVGS